MAPCTVGLPARCWLEGPSGSRVRVTETGVTLGRSAGNGIILRHLSASRAHAMVRIVGGEPELICLGRNPVTLNGSPVARRAPLAAGDRLDLPGEVLFVRLETGPPERRRCWAIEEESGLLMGLGTSSVWLGGGRNDTLRLAGLPARAALLQVLGDDLVIDVRSPLRIDQDEIPAGEVHALTQNARIEVGAHVLFARSEGAATDPTVDRSGEALPVEARFSFRPIGGVLELCFGEEWFSVELSELRGRFLAILLNPPGEHRPGEFVPDEIAIPLIWPGDPSKGRSEMNTLVHRVRYSLLNEGVNPAMVIQRLRSGGATRFRLAEDAKVVVQ